MNTKMLLRKIVLLSVLAIPGYALPSDNDYKRHFVKYEGLKTNLYYCSAGFPSVGIGHKFEKGEKVKQSYSNVEITKFFEADLKEAKKIALKVFPSFNSQPDQVQIILVSLSYNMGQAGINKFVKFRAAINKKDYKSAAKELVNSKWYRQTGKRGKDYFTILNSI